MSSWSGKSKGNILGYKIFVWTIKNLGIWAAYLLLRFVSFYYFLFSFKSSTHLFYYFNKVLNYNFIKSILSLYKNYYIFGQTLVDRAIIMAGFQDKFTYSSEGFENLQNMVTSGTGGILISAHAGNWEVAGQKLKNEIIKMNVVMFEAEHAKIKNYLSDVKKERTFNIITVSDKNLDHIYKINEALQNNELVCMHGDRYLNESKTEVCNFLGKDAKFPIGPFLLATQLNVPVSFVYGMKTSSRHYHFSATKPVLNSIKMNKQEKYLEASSMLKQYVLSLEKIVKQYPTQWFNYYQFWN